MFHPRSIANFLRKNLQRKSPENEDTYVQNL